MEEEKFDITCARCYVKFESRDREALMVAFRGHDKEAHNFMTGDEFYNKFLKEAEKILTGETEVDRLKVGDIYQYAARLAAGLEE